MSWAPDVIDESPPFLMRCQSAYELKRFQTWKSKEPELIALIDSFTDGEFWDIGANVGVYTLYCASVHPHCTIVACEPDSKNFAALCENINLNAFANVTPAQFAIGDHDGTGMFYEAGAVTGESGGQLNAALCNGMAAYPVTMRSIDSLVAEYGCPNHIKIDIDGQQQAVVDGMAQTLANPMLRSVLIEVNLADPFERVRIANTFLLNGFSESNRFNFMSDHSRYRRKSAGITDENIVFTRR